MKKKHSLYIFFVLICLLIFSCNKARKSLISMVSADTLSVDNAIFEHPFEIPVNKNSLNYVKLETTKRPIHHIDQINIYNSTIFILDRYNSSMLLFDIKGAYKKSISIKNTQFQCFDVFGNAIYILDKNQNKIFKFNLQGKLIKTFNQDFHGVQFAVLRGEKFVYNTCGLSTRDRESENYQLSITGIKINDLQLPFKNTYSGVKYFFENQFSRNYRQLFFISAFENVLYELDTSKIVALTKFDFGKYNMPDSIFQKGKAFDNFNAFPYVSDLVNTANTSRFSFFKFSYHSRQGYLLSDVKRKKIIAGGIDIATDDATDYNNAAPVGSYKDKLIAIVSPRIWLKMSLELNLSNTKLNEKYPIQAIHENDAPILLLYNLL